MQVVNKSSKRAWKKGDENGIETIEIKQQKVEHRRMIKSQQNRSQ